MHTAKCGRTYQTDNARQSHDNVYHGGRPEPCCMWCGGEKPEGGWHFLQYPQALCSEKCSTAFKAAI